MVISSDKYNGNLNMAFSNLPTIKHKPDFKHKKAVASSATLALHKVVLCVFFSCNSTFSAKTGKQYPPNHCKVVWWILCFLIGMSLCRAFFICLQLFLCVLPGYLSTVWCKFVDNFSGWMVTNILKNNFNYKKITCSCSLSCAVCISCCFWYFRC